MVEPWMPYDLSDPVAVDARGGGFAGHARSRGNGLREIFRSFYPVPLSASADLPATGRARIVLAGPPGAGRRDLLRAIWGLDSGQLPEGDDFGTFHLLDLPSGDNHAVHSAADGLSPWSSDGQDAVDRLAGVDLVLFVTDARRGLDAAGFLGFSRIRALGCPLLIVLLNPEDLPDGGRQRGRELARRLACPVLAVSPERALGLDALIARMLAASPAVAIPLGRESLRARPQVVRRLARQAALRSFLVGIEPVPLLDLPLQVAGYRRLLASLAAVHGISGAEDLRAWTAAATGGLALRLGAAQAAKLVPVAGWLVSGLIGAAGSLALAHLADQRHRGGWRWRRFGQALRRHPMVEGAGR